MLRLQERIENINVFAYVSSFTMGTCALIVCDDKYMFHQKLSYIKMSNLQKSINLIFSISSSI